MEEEQVIVHPPDSTTDAAAPDNTHDDKEKTSSSSSSSSSSSDGEEQEQNKEPEGPFESQEAVEHDPVVEKVGEMEIPVSTEVEVVGIEFLRSEKSEVGVEDPAVVAVTVASSIPVDAPVPLDEETIERADGAAGILEHLLEVDSLSHEVEVKPAPNLVLEETPVITAELPHNSGELQHDTETSESTPAAPPAGHPSSWWNCCGLFDVLKGSMGN